MVKIKKNIVTKGWSGKLGDDIVFRRKGNKTYVALSPTKSTKEPSEKQKAQTQKFKLATLFAKTQNDDPVKKARYEAFATEYQSAFNLAIADFLKAPEVKDVDVGNYSGTIGDLIKVVAIDNFEVTEVKVQIFDNGNNLIESGLAVVNSLGTQWEYTCSIANANPSGCKILATAKDYPGNITELEIVIP